MLKPHTEAPSSLTIDLSGPEGNAFVLLGTAKNLARQHRLDPEPILQEMMAGDYAHLVRTLDRHFGHCLVLIEPPGGLA
jgi:hypothetical protein